MDGMVKSQIKTKDNGKKTLLLTGFIPFNINFSSHC